MPSDNVQAKIDSLVQEIAFEEQAAKDSFRSFKMDFFKKNAAYAKDVRYSLSLNFKFKTGSFGSLGERAVLEHAENECKLCRVGGVIFSGFLLEHEKKIQKRVVAEKVLSSFKKNLEELREKESLLKENILCLRDLSQSVRFPSFFVSERKKAERELNSLLCSVQVFYFPAFTETTVMSGIVQEEESTYAEETPKT